MGGKGSKEAQEKLAQDAVNEQLRQDMLQRELEKNKLEAQQREAQEYLKKQQASQLEPIQSEEPEGEDVSVDSDIIPEDQIPPPREKRVIAVYDPEIEEILDKVQKDLLEDTMANMKITHDMITHLNSSDPEKKKQTRMFLCVVCQNFPIPKFSLGAKGVNRSSIKLSMCDSCNGLACYNCWSDLIVNTKKPCCPKCKSPIDLPEDFDAVKTKKEGTFEKYMSLCTQKILLNILYSQPITHRCRILRSEAMEKARHLYSQQMNEKLEAKRRQQEIDAKLEQYSEMQRQLVLKDEEIIQQEMEFQVQIEEAKEVTWKKATAPKPKPPLQIATVLNYEIKYEFDEEAKRREEELARQKSREFAELKIAYAKQAEELKNRESEGGDLELEHNVAPQIAVMPLDVTEEEKQHLEEEEEVLSSVHSLPVSSKKQRSSQPSLTQELISHKSLSVKGKQSPDLKDIKMPTPNIKITTSPDDEIQNEDDFTRQIRRLETKLEEPRQSAPPEISSPLIKRSKPKNNHQSIIERDFLDGRNNLPEANEGTEEVFESHSINSDTNHDLISQQMRAESERKMKQQEEETANLKAMFKNEEAEKKRKALMGKFLEMEEEEVRASMQSRQSYMKEGGEATSQRQYGYNKSKSLHEALQRRDFDITEHSYQGVRFEEDTNLIAQETAIDIDSELDSEENINQLSDQLYQTTYTYLDYLNHILTDCEDSQVVEGGCPYPKCKFHDPVPIKKLRDHLVNDCTKITLQCNICKDKFRRPWVPYHECLNVYEDRLGNATEQLISKDEEIQKSKAQNDVTEKLLQKERDLVRDYEIQFAETKKDFQQKLIEKKQIDIKQFKRKIAKQDTVQRIGQVLETQQNQEDSYFDTMNSEKDFKDTQSHANFHSPKKIVIHTQKNLKILKQKQMSDPQVEHLDQTKSVQESKKEEPKKVSEAAPEMASPKNLTEVEPSVKALTAKQEDVASVKSKLTVKPISIKKSELKSIQDNQSQQLKSVQDNRSQQSKVSRQFQPKTPVDKSWGGLKLTAKKVSVERENISEILNNLRGVEKEIATLDRYVAYCLKKYRQFNYELKHFSDDQLILQAVYTEAYLIEEGNFKGMLFWGQHLDVDSTFEPHGMGIFVDIKNKIVQFGTYKHGKEYGLQRIIQSAPVKERQFTTFNSIGGTINGNALIERATGKVEAGKYLSDKQTGTWRSVYLNGEQEIEVYDNGKLISRKVIQPNQNRAKTNPRGDRSDSRQRRQNIQAVPR